jgi:BirA family transcriptional regulator, biotin operon repressor / biotin---[acetyl-CoA-carboxylase] ligase
MPLDVQLVRSRFPERAISWRATIPSTMPEAVRLAADGAPSGMVIGADEQTAGYGRYSRAWHSERDVGLYLSIILRLPLSSSAPTIALALGLATAAAIERTCGVACDLRWPNDVLIAARKCAGILVQLHEQAIIAGIGINVNHESFPPDVRQLATSIRMASGRMQSREQLLIELLEEIDVHCAVLVERGVEPVLAMFERASSYVSGRRVTVDNVITGTTGGLTAEGFLRLRCDDGTEQIILAGGVRPALDS